MNVTSGSGVAGVGLGIPEGGRERGQVPRVWKPRSILKTITEILPWNREDRQIEWGFADRANGSQLLPATRRMPATPTECQEGEAE